MKIEKILAILLPIYGMYVKKVSAPINIKIGDDTVRLKMSVDGKKEKVYLPTRDNVADNVLCYNPLLEDVTKKPSIMLMKTVDIFEAKLSNIVIRSILSLAEVCSSESAWKALSDTHQTVLMERGNMPDLTGNDLENIIKVVMGSFDDKLVNDWVQVKLKKGSKSLRTAILSFPILENISDAVRDNSNALGGTETTKKALVNLKMLCDIVIGPTGTVFSASNKRLTSPSMESMYRLAGKFYKSLGVTIDIVEGDDPRTDLNGLSWNKELDYNIQKGNAKIPTMRGNSGRTKVAPATNILDNLSRDTTVIDTQPHVREEVSALPIEGIDNTPVESDGGYSALPVGMVQHPMTGMNPAGGFMSQEQMLQKYQEQQRRAMLSSAPTYGAVAAPTGYPPTQYDSYGRPCTVDALGNLTPINTQTANTNAGGVYNI